MTRTTTIRKPGTLTVLPGTSWASDPRTRNLRDDLARAKEDNQRLTRIERSQQMQIREMREEIASLRAKLDAGQAGAVDVSDWAEVKPEAHSADALRASVGKPPRKRTAPRRPRS